MFSMLDNTSLIDPFYIPDFYLQIEAELYSNHLSFLFLLLEWVPFHPSQGEIIPMKHIHVITKSNRECKRGQLNLCYLA
jgi:hypothetical protein